MIVDLLYVDRVVKIAGIIRVDRDDEFFAQILAVLEHSPVDAFGNSICFIDNVFRKFSWQIVLANDRQHVDAGRRRGPEDFDDLAFRIDMTRLPRLEANNDLVATGRRFR